jgi:hypothetical protein
LKCITSGGKLLAADTLEKVYLAGSEHLVDNDYDKI